MTPTLSHLQVNSHGRVLPVGLHSAAHANSRRYFQIERRTWPIAEILERLQTHLGISQTWTVKSFGNQIERIKNRLRKDDALINLLNGVHVPFILPRIATQDPGGMLDSVFIPAVGRAFEEFQSVGRFVNHVPYTLNGRVSVPSHTRHQALLGRACAEEIVGIYFPCLSEYSVAAAQEIIERFPPNIYLSGGADTAAALVAAPDLLIRTNGYPPLLWMSGLESDTNGIGYHFESYGFNLTFNRRAHLGLAAEYWWSGLTVFS